MIPSLPCTRSISAWILAAILSLSASAPRVAEAQSSSAADTASRADALEEQLGLLRAEYNGAVERAQAAEEARDGLAAEVGEARELAEQRASDAEEAESLRAAAKDASRILAVTYNYTGYPMVRQARAMIERGDLGTIRSVHARYVQDWLSQPVESDGQKQAEWRTDPARSGAGGCIGNRRARSAGRG